MKKCHGPKSIISNVKFLKSSAKSLKNVTDFLRKIKRNTPVPTYNIEYTKEKVLMYL